MLAIASSRWADLRTGNGNASDFPGVLTTLRVADDETAIECAFRLCDVCHDWSTYDATYAVTPHLVHQCVERKPDDETRIRLLSMTGWFTACLRLNQTPADSDLIEWHAEALPTAALLASESLPFTVASRDAPPVVQTRTMCAAFAAFHGDYPLSFILYELDAGGTKCPTCNSFFSPYRSSLNPFFNGG